VNSRTSTASTEETLLIAGLGGVGIVTMGDLLARAATHQHPHVASLGVPMQDSHRHERRVSPSFPGASGY
jgi:hypothetical protein